MKYDVVSITDTIGTMQVPLKTGNKLTPYFFATRKELLMKYLDVDWSPDAMPYTETFGLLTEALLKDGAKVYEMEDDKSNILFDGTQDGEKSKDLGYMHIRSGSVPALLLAYRDNDYQKYEDYMVQQPRQEYLRQFAWYYLMTDTDRETWSLRPKIWELLKDIHITEFEWMGYYDKFLEYHGLK